MFSPAGHPNYQQFFEPAVIELPRLLYIGDVPVEASFHGSALLHRLLEGYSTDRIAIIEAGTDVSLPARRLAGVSYYRALPRLKRLQLTRYASWYAAGCLITARFRSRSWKAVARHFRPQAILTVSHGYSWLSAAQMARELNIPLHLVCHDHWPHTVSAPAAMAGWLERTFRRNYLEAASRLCVSPFMASDYEKCYGVTGQVLYPSRAADALRFEVPVEPNSVLGRPFTCIFAGTINMQGMIEALKLLAKSLRMMGGRLLILGPVEAAVRTSGLTGDNIDFGGLIPADCIISELRHRGDALFVPMSFAAQDRKTVEVSFPSKLTDYTAVGLPLLIYGPYYSSAVRWAADSPGLAELVTEHSETAMNFAIERLVGDPEHRRLLAVNALIAGDHYFSREAATKIFFGALRRPNTISHTTETPTNKSPPAA